MRAAAISLRIVETSWSYVRLQHFQMAALLSMQAPPQNCRAGVVSAPRRRCSTLDERSTPMPFIPLAMIAAGLVGNLLLVLLLLGDATAPGRMPLVLAAVLALGGGALLLGGLMLLEPRRRDPLDHRS
jgi:hypothetical protein